MGQSTNAILFYGYCWNEEGDIFSEGENTEDDEDVERDEWSHRVAKKRGHMDPWNSYPRDEIETLPYYREQRAAGEKWAEDNRQALDKWHEVIKAIEAEFGVDVGYHCSCDCPMSYVFVVASCTTARRGYPEKINPNAILDPGATEVMDWNERLDKWFKELGVSKPPGQDAPGWWLVSHWC